MTNKTCRRCGACCYLYKDNIKRKCKNLVLHPGINITSCRIYSRKKRVGSKTHKINGKIYYCGNREGSYFDYLGCPYNDPRAANPVINPDEFIDIKDYNFFKKTISEIFLNDFIEEFSGIKIYPEWNKFVECEMPNYGGNKKLKIFSN